MFARNAHAARTRWLITLAVFAGLGVRLLLLIAADWRYDYDEGMVGLQVLRIQHGSYPVFHPGQPYLGALESYLIAPLFAMGGANAVTLKLIPWLLSGGYIASVGWLGWRAFDQRAAVLSALMAACAPAYLLVVGMKTWGATAETLLLGNLALIAASYTLDRSLPVGVRQHALILLGVISGVAFWVSWLIVFFVIPVGIALLVWGRVVVRRTWWQVGLAFFAGSAPFWGYNLTHDLATFRYLLRDQGDTWRNMWPVLDHLNYDLSPRLVSGDPAWHILSWPAIWWLQIVYEGGLVVLIGYGVRDHDHPTRIMLALFALCLPVIYVLSGYGNHALNQHGFDATGRYVLVIHAVLPIGAAALSIGMARWRTWLRFPAAAVVTSVVALNLLGAARMNPRQAFVSPYYTRQPATLDPLIVFLDEQQIRHVWTDVGVAHVLMFATEERILAADWYDLYGAKGILRFPEVPQAIAAADRVAFVEVIFPGQTNTPFELAFQASGVPHTVYRVAPDLLVIIPLAPIDPATLGNGLGYQF